MTTSSRLKFRWLAAAWLSLVTVLLILALIRGPVFDSSILTLLPETGQQSQVQSASVKLAEEYSNRLILLVAIPRDEDALSSVETLAAGLGSLDAVAKVRWKISDEEVNKFHSELFPYRFQLIDPETRGYLADGDLELIRDRALIRLFAPLGMGTGALVDDPFGLQTEYMRHLSNELKLERVGGLLKLRGPGDPTYLVEVRLAGDPFSPQVQQAVLQQIGSARLTLADRVKSIQISGMLLHAAAGAEQAQREISTIGLGSLVGVLIVMLLVFGRVKSLLLVLLPVTVGCLFAAAVTLLIFGRVHLVTFAFGAGLVGVSIDYALHYLCERRYSPVDQVLKRILPGLALGLFSSVIAYAAMLLTPFPGLRQMATFSVAGLIGAWLTVLICLPGLTATDQLQDLAMADRLDRLRRGYPRLAGNNPLMVILFLVAIGSLGLVWNSSARDDVRLLQTSPAKLLLEEKEVQRRLGGSSSAQFLLVQGSNLEACLQIEESITPNLRQLVSEGFLEGFVALSESVPSLDRQQNNLNLIYALYDQQLEPMYKVLQLDGSYLQKANASLAESGKSWLTAENLQSLSVIDGGQGLIVHQGVDSAATMIRFEGPIDSVTRDRLHILVDHLEGVTFVDRIDNISGILKEYRVQIQSWIVLAYLGVLGVFLLRYRAQVWRIVIPPVLASLLTLAALVQFEQGINLFHLIALILVLGIGLDMGIFMQETNGAASTWLAVSLSAMTSLLAFGLLALSKTPVLHHFGITVAIGLCLVWLLSPLVARCETS